MYVRRTDIKPFDKKVWLASPTMHGDELKYITEAYDSNWMSTVARTSTRWSISRRRRRK